jgi:hypothetical protein
MPLSPPKSTEQNWEPNRGLRRPEKQGVHMKKIILFTLTLLLAACSASTPNEFEKNQALWDDANISHYRYTLSLSCFCAFMDDMPLTIEVQNDQIVSITSGKGTAVDATNPSYSIFESYIPMENLFAELKSALEEADEVTVTYDATYGFPTSIAIDQIKEATDDELWITVENFEVLN